MLKVAYSEACAGIKIEEENYKVTALVSGLRCIYDIKCQICYEHSGGHFALVSTLLSKWKELKPCQH